MINYKSKKIQNPRKLRILPSVSSLGIGFAFLDLPHVWKGTRTGAVCQREQQREHLVAGVASNPGVLRVF